MKKYLIKNALVFSIKENEEIKDVYIKDGLIKKIEKNIELTLKEKQDLEIIDGTGKILMPGFIEVHTHLGINEESLGSIGSEANEKTTPFAQFVRAMDALNPFDEGFEDARRSGVTTAHVMPGSANIIGGQTCVVKTFGNTVEEMLVKKEAGLKIALGENPRKNHSTNGELTRMGIMGHLRDIFYNVKYNLNENEKLLPKNKVILDVLEKKYPVRIHAHRSDDIMSAIRFSEEFDLDLRIEHCTEGHLISEQIKEKVSHISIGPTISRRSKSELKNKSWDTYKILNDTGINISITTDHPIIPVQYLNVSAALTVREGLSKDEALKAITINPAMNLGIDDRVGTIEIGKDADLVLWDKHPFEYDSHVLITFINGNKVYEK